MTKAVSDATDELLTLKLSQSLISKLKHSAQEEGVEIEALVAELLAEGITLRAWEIIERKSAMRSSNAVAQPQHQPFNNQRHGNTRHGGARPPANNNWMEDKAAFLEYVRNQEKRGRR